MLRSEQTTRAAQRESDLQRWADDGGFIGEQRTNAVAATPRSPWLTVALAAAAGFAIGWLTASQRGGR